MRAGAPRATPPPRYRRSRSSTKVRSGELAPPAVLGRHSPGPPQAEERSDQAGQPEGDQRSTEISHVGLGRIELPTSSLSGMRSNRLSYSPGSAAPDVQR